MRRSRTSFCSSGTWRTSTKASFSFYIGQGEQYARCHCGQYFACVKGAGSAVTELATHLVFAGGVAACILKVLVDGEELPF